MAVTCIATVQPVDATQRDNLRKLFSSSGYLTLRELVASRCVERQTKAMQALVYSNNESASLDRDRFIEEASFLNAVIDLLDDIAQNEDDWNTVKLETRQ